MTQEAGCKWLTYLGPHAVCLLLHDHGRQVMLGLDPKGHRDDRPNPVHEVVPLQVQQDELLGGLCKVGLQAQDAE